MHQLSSNSTVHSAAHGTYDTSFHPTYLSNTGNLLPYKFLLEKYKHRTSEMTQNKNKKHKQYHRPIRATSTNIPNKLPDDSLSTGSMGNFWVELDPIDWLGLVRHRCIRCRYSVSDNMEVGWRLG